MIIPGFNDTDAELKALARFLAGVDRAIPWHVTAFHRDYKLTDPPDTGAGPCCARRRSGARRGFSSSMPAIGPGRSAIWRTPAARGCSTLLIERQGYLVRRNRIAGGSCPDCGQVIPGRWTRPARPAAISDPPPAQAAGECA